MTEIRDLGGRLTEAEMIALFGRMYPTAVARLIWDAPGQMTVREIRVKIREMAGKKAEP